MERLTKTDLINRVAAMQRATNPVSRGDVERIVNKTLEVIEVQLAHGDEVSLGGFGKFATKTEADGRVATFAPGAELRRAIARSDEKGTE